MALAKRYHACAVQRCLSHALSPAGHWAVCTNTYGHIVPVCFCHEKHQQQQASSNLIFIFSETRRFFNWFNCLLHIRQWMHRIIGSQFSVLVRAYSFFTEYLLTICFHINKIIILMAYEHMNVNEYEYICMCGGRRAHASRFTWMSAFTSLSQPKAHSKEVFCSFFFFNHFCLFVICACKVKSTNS